MRISMLLSLFSSFLSAACSEGGSCDSNCSQWVNGKVQRSCGKCGTVQN